MAYGSLKADQIVYTTATGDVAVNISGVYDVANVIAGFDPITKSITSTGTISGHIYKTSGNITVISGSGDIRPYGQYSFPPGTGTSGQIMITNGNGTSSWANASGFITIAQTIALN